MNSLQLLSGAALLALASSGGAVARTGQQAGAAAGAGQRQAAEQPAPDELDRLEQQARIELLRAQARLELLRARKALRARRYADAARGAQRALGLLKTLRGSTDVSVYELQAEGILARAARAGVALERVAATAPAARPPAATSRLDDQLHAAADIARGYTGADTPDIDTSGDAAALRQRTLWNQLPDEHGYRPSKQIIDVEALLERDRQRLYYQDALRTAYRAAEARLLVEADEARVAPQGWVSYPDDWPEMTARREQYRGGVIARSPGWIDDQGRQWYVALYDIRDLIYVPPDFQPPMGVTVQEQLRNLFDRDALRLQSEIFRGYAEDLALGIPLLRYFGGVDDRADPRYSAERQQQIVELIKAFVGPRKAEPTIEAIAPTRRPSWPQPPPPTP